LFASPLSLFFPEKKISIKNNIYNIVLKNFAVDLLQVILHLCQQFAIPGAEKS